MRCILVFLFFMCSAEQAIAQDFNKYILEAVQNLAEDRAGLGYDIHSKYTQNLSYDDASIRSTGGTKTMCVAAMVEVIVEAMALYDQEKPQDEIFGKIPTNSWTRGNRKSLLGHIFMFRGFSSRGTAHALAKFQLGEELTFESLKPGDFINLNRSHSGHAVIFLSYLKSDYNEVQEYDREVVGFKYFSAQGKNSDDAGFGYRYAYFQNKCPTKKDGFRRDCGVIRSSNKKLLNTGRMFHPDEWNYRQAVNDLLEARADQLMDGDNPTRSIALTVASAELSTELPFEFEIPNYFSGETTD